MIIRRVIQQWDCGDQQWSLCFEDYALNSGGKCDKIKICFLYVAIIVCYRKDAQSDDVKGENLKLKMDMGVLADKKKRRYVSSNEYAAEPMPAQDCLFCLHHFTIPRKELPWSKRDKFEDYTLKVRFIVTE